jgi:hypothetical protein
MTAKNLDEEDTQQSAEQAREALADVRDVVADARDALADAREEQAGVADRRRDDRDLLADERDRLSQERDEMATAAEVARDERDAQAGERRDVIDDARDRALPSFRRVVAELLTAATHRDFLANRRDIAANRRDIQANLDALLTELPGEAYFEARTFARQDRYDSRRDRTESAQDRTTLTIPTGLVHLPASIPTQRNLRKPLDECTPTEVSLHCEELLAASLIELSEAIEIVEHDGAASSHAKSLLHSFKQRHETATDLIWYVSEWLATGNRPQAAQTN